MVEWRRQSADVRTRAEAERARWEALRAREREEQQRQSQRQQIPRADTTGVSGVSATAESPSVSTSEWETVSVGATQQGASATGPDASGGESAPLHSHSQEGGPPTTTQVTSLFFFLLFLFLPWLVC